jgi:hypothetical protein
MKKAIELVACLAGFACVQALGEATVSFITFGPGVNAPITILTDDGQRVPVGDENSEYWIQLYAGPAGDSIDDVNSLAARALIDGGQLAAASGQLKPFASPAPGYFVGPNIDVEDVVLGIDGGASLDTVSVLVYAQNDSGTLFGWSNVIGDQPTGGGTTTPAFMTDLKGFPLIPEPSTIALALLGASVLFLRRRK